MIGEIDEFLTGDRRPPEHDRVLATVLFTDIVGSTVRAAALGDETWRDLLARARPDRPRQPRAATAAARSSRSATASSPLFDGPARAVRAARSIVADVTALGLEVRAGLHTGEVELVGDDVAGLAVHIAARVMGEAPRGPGARLEHRARPRRRLRACASRTAAGASCAACPGEWGLWEVDGVNFARDVVDAAPPEQLAIVELARDGARREWRFGEVAEQAGAAARAARRARASGAATSC